MRFVYIINTRIPTEKAYGYQVAKVCSEVAQLGHDISLWAPKVKNPLGERVHKYYGVSDNFSVRFLPSVSFADGRMWFVLRSILFLFVLAFTHPEKGTVIYTRSPEIAWLFHLKGYKTAYSAHSWPERNTKLFSFFVRSTDKIICNSRGTEKKFNEHGFSNTTVAPNGVDVSEFDIIQTKEELREELNLPKEKAIALYTGHLYRWKGSHVILEVAKKMYKRKDILFVFVGGTEKDIASYKKLKEEHGLSNILLMGHKKRVLIPKYMKAADVLLLSNVAESKESIHYTSPIKMFEYMASGVPIVASNLPSIGEVLSDENALLVAPGDAEALKNNIEDILLDTKKSTTLALRARKDVEKYTWEGHARTLVEPFL